MNVRSNFEHFETNMTLMANVFRKLQTAKDVAKQMSKKSLFRTPFKKRHGKRFQTLLKSSDQHLYYIHSSLRKQLSWKETLLVIYKDLGLFVNTLTADDKYSLLSRDNLTQKFLMKLPKKEKATSRVSAAFLKSRLYFEYFPKKKKMTFIASAFPRLRTPKDMVT